MFPERILFRLDNNEMKPTTADSVTLGCKQVFLKEQEDELQKNLVDVPISCFSIN